MRLLNVILDIIYILIAIPILIMIVFLAFILAGLDEIMKRIRGDKKEYLSKEEWKMY